MLISCEKNRDLDATDYRGRLPHFWPPIPQTSRGHVSLITPYQWPLFYPPNVQGSRSRGSSPALARGGGRCRQGRLRGGPCGFDHRQDAGADGVGQVGPSGHNTGQARVIFDFTGQGKGQGIRGGFRNLLAGFALTAIRQRIANPPAPVRIREGPLFIFPWKTRQILGSVGVVIFVRLCQLCLNLGSAGKCVLSSSAASW